MAKGRKKIVAKIEQAKLLEDNDCANKIYRYFVANPGNDAKKCASDLGLQISRVYSNIKKLYNADLLTKREEKHNGHTTAYYSAVDVSVSSMKDNSVQSTMDYKKEDGNMLCGLFQYKSFNKTLEESRELADPLPLWKTLWYEGEICCLFGDTGTGKSILAVQIAKEIAEKKKILYFDFELSEKQFEMRYKDTDGNLCNFPDKIMIKK